MVCRCLQLYIHYIAELLGQCRIYIYIYGYIAIVEWVKMNQLGTILHHIALCTDVGSILGVRNNEECMQTQTCDVGKKPRTYTVHPSMVLGHMCQNDPKQMCFVGKYARYVHLARSKASQVYS